MGDGQLFTDSVEDCVPLVPVRYMFILIFIKSSMLSPAPSRIFLKVFGPLHRNLIDLCFKR